MNDRRRSPSDCTHSTLTEWEPDELLLQFVQEAQNYSSSGAYHDPNIPLPPATVTFAADSTMDSTVDLTTDLTMDLTNEDFPSSLIADLGVDSFLHGRIITVLVGGETGRSWSIHESLLSAKSPYFRRLLNDTEDGLKMQEVVFRDIDPKLFRMLISWLYGTSFGATAGQRVFRYPVPDGEEYTVSD